MAHCLDNYIGLRGCGSTTPPSGLYVNDLPGMSLENLVTLTNTDEPTYSDIWTMVQTRAQNRFSLDVREAMGKHYKLNSLMQGINVGNDVGSLAANVPAYTGFTIELIDQNYEFVPSPFASIHVQQIKFYCDDTVNGVPFEIWDLDPSTYTNQVRWSATIDIIEGENVIEVNQTFHNLYISPSWRLAIVVDSQALTGLMYNMELPYSRSMMSCCDVRVQGFNFNSGPLTNATFSNNTYGVSGIFSIVCNWDAMICQNKTLFSRAYWYLLGIEVLTEQLYSSKLNQFTTVNLQRLNELRAEYQVEYSKSLEQVAGGLKLSCDCCIECNESVQLREATQFY
jgi:hypothetical protein